MYRKRSAFTLVELMVSMSILVLMMGILLQMTNQTAATWHNGAAKAEQFQEARKAFETMTGRISNATLNTYYDYAYDPKADQTGNYKVGDVSTAATDYVRQSDLRFRVLQMSTVPLNNEAVLRPTQGVFFQAPFGMVDYPEQFHQLDDLLNCWGYFVEVADTSDRLPAFLVAGAAKRFRSRLMEFRQPAEEFTLYSTLKDKILKTQTNVRFPQRDPLTSALGKVTNEDDAWFTTPMNLSLLNKNRPVRVLAENIMALVLLPRLSAADQKERNAADSGVPPDYQNLTPDFTFHSKQTSNYLNDGFSPPVMADATSQAVVAAPINPKNQLPPVVQIAMFAIDEASAQKLFLKEGNLLGVPTMLRNGGNDLFAKSANLETSTATPDGGDLAAFEAQLISRQLSYRLFTSNISLRGAKWSRAATK